MNLPGADDLAIQQLRICRRDGSGLSQAAVNQVKTQLESTDWPDPGEAWVFIRSLRTRSSTQAVGQHLLQATRASLQQSDGQEVVRFANLAEMLAALIADLLSGQAGQRWYWQRWSDLFALPLAQSLELLLAGQVALLPTLVAHLDRRGLLLRFLSNVNDASAYQLSKEMAWRGGFSLPTEQQIQQTRNSQSQAETVALTRWLQPRQAALLKRWQPVHAQLSGTPHKQQLTLLLMGFELSPLLLQRTPTTLLGLLENALAAVRADTPAHSQTNPVAAKGVTRTAQIPQREMASPFSANRHDVITHIPRTAHKVDSKAPQDKPIPGREQTPAPLPSASESPESVAAANVTTTADNLPESQAAPNATLINNPGVLPETQEHSPGNAPTATDFEFESLLTHQAGLLYLLNFLNRSEVQTLMGDYWEQLPNGWAWLYRLGQSLQLDETDPITGLIAHQLGFNHARQLEQLPPLPQADALLALAHRWYGRSGVWQPTLLSLTARIRVSPTHIDLDASLRAVQLPIRLAGLDINPGWLPWLGKVVSFHYD